jgi:hypothetical protein
VKCFKNEYFEARGIIIINKMSDTIPERHIIKGRFLFGLAFVFYVYFCFFSMFVDFNLTPVCFDCLPGYNTTGDIYCRYEKDQNIVYVRPCHLHPVKLILGVLLFMYTTWFYIVIITAVN